MTKLKYTNLDAIRGIAAILIVFRHTPLVFTSPRFQQSYLAVDLFFAMSGFVVAHAYEARLLSGDLTFFSFLKLRLTRLFPLYFAGILIGLFSHFAQETNPSNEGLRAAVSTASFTLLPLLMLPSRAKPLYPVNNPAWSLFYEIVANSVYARTVKRIGTRMLIGIMVPSAVVISAYSLTHNGVDAGWDLSGWYIALARVAFSFSVGVLLYRKRASTRRESARLSALALVGVILLLCIDIPARWVGIATAVDVILAVPFIVFLATSFEPPSFVVPAFKQLGRISYGLYVIHVPILWVISRLPVNSGRIYGAPALISFVFAMLIFVSILDKYFDLPARVMLSRLFAQKEENSTRAGIQSTP